jgi:signal transduction histidine kinase
VPDEPRGRRLRLARVAGPDGAPWRVFQARIEPPAVKTRPPSGDANRGDEPLYPHLTLTAAAPLGPDDASLRQLGWALAALSLVVWTAAAVVGRGLCRRALAPVQRMAASAAAIPAGEPGRRLEVAATGDELEELGRSFNGLLDRLQEAFERQRRFTGEASHQLRTPLAVMLGQVEVALRRERPPEEYRRVLGVVAEQSGRLQRVVEMLLFLARADADAGLPGVAPLALRAWLGEHLRAWATHPRAADLRLQGEAQPVIALAHAPLLGQAVDALIDNALKYSMPSSLVTLSLVAEGGCVLLTVEDSGCGIEARDLPHVFEPFFRSPRQTNNGGVGLGLALARRVVTAMGGEITAHSEAGRGSRFVVRLRRAGGEARSLHPPEAV